MARLIGESVDYVCSHRLEVAKAFAKENDVIVVLKGANTVVTNGNDVFFNMTDSRVWQWAVREICFQV